MHISEIILRSIKRRCTSIWRDGIIHLFKLIKWLRRFSRLTYGCNTLTSIDFFSLWSASILDGIIDLMNGLQATSFAVFLNGSHARSHTLFFINWEYLELRILYHCCGHSLSAIIILLRILQRWRLRCFF